MNENKKTSYIDKNGNLIFLDNRLVSVITEKEYTVVFDEELGVSVEDENGCKEKLVKQVAESMVIKHDD